MFKRIVGGGIVPYKNTESTKTKENCYVLKNTSGHKYFCISSKDLPRLCTNLEVRLASKITFLSFNILQTNRAGRFTHLEKPLPQTEQM